MARRQHTHGLAPAAAAARSPSPAAGRRRATDRATHQLVSEQTVLQVYLAILEVQSQQLWLRWTADGYWRQSLPGLLAGWLALLSLLWHRWSHFVITRCPELRPKLLSSSFATHVLLLWLGLFFTTVFHVWWGLLVQMFSSPWGVICSVLLARVPAVTAGTRWTPKQVKGAIDLLAAVFAAWLLWPTTTLGLGPADMFLLSTRADHGGPLNGSFAETGLDDNTRDLPTDIELRTLPHFVPPVTSGLVVKVYDGDTITLAAMIPCLSPTPFKFPVRLRGIDTPELRTRDVDEREAAVIARDALSSMIDGRVVELSDVGTDKYGRLLADVMIPGDPRSLSQWLIQQRHAVAYGGGTKSAPSSWLAHLRGEDEW